MKIARLLLPFISAVTLTACKPPSHAELIGTWRDEDTGAMIRLNANGTAKLIDWPRSKVFDVDDERRISLSGRWTDKAGEGQLLWSSMIWDFQLDLDDYSSLKTGANFGWCGFPARACILVVRGDPDSADELVFFKRDPR